MIYITVQIVGASALSPATSRVVPGELQEGAEGSSSKERPRRAKTMNPRVFRPDWANV